MRTRFVPHHFFVFNHNSNWKVHFKWNWNRNSVVSPNQHQMYSIGLFSICKSSATNNIIITSNQWQFVNYFFMQIFSFEFWNSFLTTNFHSWNHIYVLSSDMIECELNYTRCWNRYLMIQYELSLLDSYSRFSLSRLFKNNQMKYSNMCSKSIEILFSFWLI